MIALIPAFAGAAASCSSEPNDDPPSSIDAGEGASPVDAPGEPPMEDAGKTSPDPARSDAGPLPIVCTSPPCATALVATLADGFCALLEDRTVACWGRNFRAQLGRGEEGPLRDSPTPARVVGLTKVVALEHTCAIDEDGAAWCWGIGPFLRDDWMPMTTERVPVKLPIPAAVRVAAARYLWQEAVACAETVTGEVLCWGTNQSGQVVPPDVAVDPMMPLSPRSIPLPPGAPIQQLVVGRASFILRQDGTLLSWGANPPLGRLSSLFPDPYPRELALSGVTSIDVKEEGACATAEGIAYCWGRPLDYYDELTLTRALPERIPTPEPVVRIATSGTTRPTYPQRGCAVGVSGTVYCWGTNNDGQAGDGTKTYARTAVKVAGLPAPAADVKVTEMSSCALLTNGKIVCWGDSSHGQLGNGRFVVPSLDPVEVLLP